MLNIELAVLQTLDHDDWKTLDEISSHTRLRQESAAEALSDLNQSGIVEFRSNLKTTQSGTEIIEWRSQNDSLETYLKQNIPNYY